MAADRGDEMRARCVERLFVTGSGCVNGNYYLFLTEGGFAADSDPVIRLQQSYDVWRAGLAGVPDHYRSRVHPATQALVADGLSSTTVTVELVDADGVPLTSGGALLTIKKVAPSGKPTAKAGPVMQHRVPPMFRLGQ